MIQHLISVFDAKTGSFWPPQGFDHIAGAVRSFVLMARTKPDLSLVQFPEDYSLYDVGAFDTVSGGIQPTIPPNFVESLTGIVAEARREVTRA